MSLVLLSIGVSPALSVTNPQDPVMIRLDPLPVVGDVSKINDPNVLLDQLATSQLQTLMLMTGGFINQPNASLDPWAIREWDRQFIADEKIDQRVRRLIELRPSAYLQIHKRLNGLASSNSLTSHLVIALRSIGTKESIPLLIKRLEHDSKAGEVASQESMQIDITDMAVTSALWKLTGRKHVFTYKQWNTWWQSVEPDFTVQRDRELPEYQSQVTADRVNRIVKLLSTDEEAARERLISLGSAAVSHLLAELSVELQKLPPSDVKETNVNASPQLLRLAWVIDELEAADKLPPGLRRKYFTQRFAIANNESTLQPLFEDTVCRALNHCSFADYCSICLESSVSPAEKNLRGFSWANINLVVFNRRFGTKPTHVFGDPSYWPVWNQVTPADDPQAEIAAAVPVIIGGLKDLDPSIRACATRLADIVGLCSYERPDELILALLDGWLAETDANVRSGYWLAMSRFSTPLVLQAISDGLKSEREDIVSDAAAMVDWTNFKLNLDTQADFKRLVDLTRHKNDRLRERAVRGLRGKAPALLAPEFERLTVDHVENIRKECAMALRDEPDPKYADVLFKLADDSSEQVRIEALTSIGNLHHLPSMERLVPHLQDEKVWGWAVSALAEMGGQEALPIMFNQLESGNDVGGMIYQHLRRITGKSFDDLPAVWLRWWNQAQARVRRN